MKQPKSLDRYYTASVSVPATPAFPADYPRWCRDAHAAIVALGIEKRQRREARQRKEAAR
jgi:hypothetical protein